MSVCVEPWYRYRRGKPVSVWPNITPLVKKINSTDNLHCELVLGQRAVEEKAKVLTQIINGRASLICGLVWMEKPPLQLVADLAIEHPYLNQAIRLSHSDLNDGDSYHLRHSLGAWSAVGVHELLVPTQDDTNPIMVAWEEALRLILSRQSFTISPDRTRHFVMQGSDPVMIEAGHANLPHTSGSSKDKHLLRQRLLAEEGLTA